MYLCIGILVYLVRFQLNVAVAYIFSRVGFSHADHVAGCKSWDLGMTIVMFGRDADQFTRGCRRDRLMGMSNTSRVEPGLLPTYRLFLGLRAIGLTLLLIWLGRPLAQSIRDVTVTRPLMGVRLLSITISLLLLLYLFARPLQRRLGSWYLPLALGIDILGVMVAAVLSLILERDQGGGGIFSQFWPLMINLFLVLVLISWQYGMPGVFRLCGLMLLLDLIFGIPLSVVGYTRLVYVLLVDVIRAAIFVFVGYLISRLISAQRTQQAALTAANRQLIQYAATVEELAVSRERNRLARELHDTLAHSLSGLAVQLEAVNTLIDQDPAAAKSRVEQSLSVTRQGLTDARRAIQALRAEPLETLGLAAALQELAEGQAAEKNLTLTTSIMPPESPLPPLVEEGVYKIAKEGVANVVRHAEASQLHLRLAPERSGLVLEIRDDGVGFETGGNANGRYGLRGMQERATAIGGRLTVASQPGQGTTLRLEVDSR